MIRLKRFNESEDRPQYYTKLDWNEYPMTNHPMMEKIIDFPEKEYEILTRIMKIPVPLRKEKWTVENHTYTYLQGIRMYLVAFEDDWFVFFYEGTYWKCDQLEGVIKLLKDKKFI
jgi:hypothetical protein